MQSFEEADRQTRDGVVNSAGSLRNALVENVTSADGRRNVTSTRRDFIMNTVVSAASLATASAIATPRVVDPIYSAIEDHKRTLQDHMRCVWHLSCASDARPSVGRRELASIKKADRAAYEAYYRAATALITVRPTTVAGAAALLDHVDRFNAGEFVLAEDDRWRSALHMWPGNRLGDDEAEDLFPFGILKSLRRSLAAISQMPPVGVPA